MVREQSFRGALAALASITGRQHLGDPRSLHSTENTVGTYKVTVGRHGEAGRLLSMATQLEGDFYILGLELAF